MLGIPVNKPGKSAFDLDYVGIKASQFSFTRLQGADPVLGVDMTSTGEVGCIGDDTNEAILKAMLSVGYKIPRKSILMSTGSSKQKVALLDGAKMLHHKGYTIYATEGTQRFLNENGIPAIRVYWPEDGKYPNVIDMLHERNIDMVVNIPKNLSSKELSNGYKIRRAATDLNISLITNPRLAAAFIKAFCELPIENISIKSWSEYN